MSSEFVLTLPDMSTSDKAVLNIIPHNRACEYMNEEAGFESKVKFHFATYQLCGPDEVT